MRTQRANADKHAKRADEPEKTAQSQSAGKPPHPSKNGNGNGKHSGNGVVAQVIGNTSLFAAVLIYMGWNYENSFLTFFLCPSVQRKYRYCRVRA